MFILLDKMHSLFQLLVWIQPRELLLDIRGTSPGDNHGEYVRIKPRELLLDIRGTSPVDNHSEHVWIKPRELLLDIRGTSPRDNHSEYVWNLGYIHESFYWISEEPRLGIIIVSMLC